MIIDGRTFKKDLVLLEDRVIEGWWRREGHKLWLADLDDVLATAPRTFVLGTGAYGVLKVTRDAEQLLQQKGIELIAEPSTRAWQTYNSLAGPGVVAAFHLTC